MDFALLLMFEFVCSQKYKNCGQYGVITEKDRQARRMRHWYAGQSIVAGKACNPLFYENLDLGCATASEVFVIPGVFQIGNNDTCFGRYMHKSVVV